MSAFGFLVAPPAVELLRAYVTLLDATDIRRVNQLFREMEADGRALLATAGVGGDTITVQREVAVRYAGQSYELLVPVPGGALDAARLGEVGRRFVRQYARRYRQVNREIGLEAVNWRVVVAGPRPRVKLETRVNGDIRRARKGARDIYLPERGGFVRCPVYDRYALAAGARLRGPAIVEERESTAVIGPGGVVRVDAYNNLHVTVPQAAAG
jgi:N-methylhydantoinase A/oxoprolinase/acetone carboxylase beta subunit